jgi:hypothetical protein
MPRCPLPWVRACRCGFIAYRGSAPYRRLFIDGSPRTGTDSAASHRCASPRQSGALRLKRPDITSPSWAVTSHTTYGCSRPMGRSGRPHPAIPAKASAPPSQPKASVAARATTAMPSAPMAHRIARLTPILCDRPAPDALKLRCAPTLSASLDPTMTSSTTPALSLGARLPASPFAISTSP